MYYFIRSIIEFQNENDKSSFIVEINDSKTDGIHYASEEFVYLPSYFLMNEKFDEFGCF